MKDAKNDVNKADFSLSLLSPVDVGGDGLVRRLVHTADSQPHEALLPLDKPAVGCDHRQPHY